MLIDTIIAAALAMAIWKGYSKGLIVAVFSLLAFIIGLAAAIKLSAIVAGWLGTQVNVSQKWIPLLSFIIVFIGVVFLVNMGAKLIEKSIKIVMLGWVNKIGGILFYVLLYLIILSVLLFFGKQLAILSDETIAKSSLYSYIQPLGPKIIDGFGSVIPIFKDLFVQLENFFDSIASKK
jgi:membrane protein required for colicin V production